MKKLNLLVLFAVVGVASLMAQTKDSPWAIGVYGVKTEYIGNLRVYERDNGNRYVKNTIFNFEDGMRHFGAAVSVDRYLSRFFDLGVYGSWSSIGYDYIDEESQTRRNFHSMPLWNANLHTRFKFLGQDNARLVPYLTVGVGFLSYNQTSSTLYAAYTDEIGRRMSYTGSPTYCFILNGGIGLEYLFSQYVSVRYQADFGWTNKDSYDDGITIGHKDCQLQHSLGVVLRFGGRDSDKDGVKDRYDMCPNTPRGVKVDKEGCPIDSDGDGVPDYLDKCPNTPAGVRVDANGCPLDSDGDGVPDHLDKCPNTPAGAKVDANGCPFDSDGDGVPDHLDKCPDTPAGVKVDANGCPVDSDGDGVPDHLDKCPNTPKGVKVDANGCPIDTDGDGVPDYLDKCPNVAGPASNNGCPEVKAEAKQVFQKAMHGVQFDTGKSTIKASSNKTLDEVAAVLKDNPDYLIDINGHTDNVGNPESNLKLSQDRAESVKQYLIKKGIAESRMKTAGFGDTKPIADNKTAAGRAENRRVEFVVNFER